MEMARVSEVRVRNELERACAAFRVRRPDRRARGPADGALARSRQRRRARQGAGPTAAGTPAPPAGQRPSLARWSPAPRRQSSRRRPPPRQSLRPPGAPWSSTGATIGRVPHAPPCPTSMHPWRPTTDETGRRGLRFPYGYREDRRARRTSRWGSASMPRSPLSPVRGELPTSAAIEQARDRRASKHALCNGPVHSSCANGLAGSVRLLATDDMDWQACWSQDDRMEATPRQVPSGSLGPTAPGALDVGRSGRRRRPTGQSPPLPRSIQPTGVWWAATAVVLVTLAKVAFGPARRSLGVAVTVWDDAVVGWLAGLHLPGLTGLMETIVASTGSAAAIGVLRWATLVALLV